MSDQPQFLTAAEIPLLKLGDTLLRTFSELEPSEATYYGCHNGIHLLYVAGFRDFDEHAEPMTDSDLCRICIPTGATLDRLRNGVEVLTGEGVLDGDSRFKPLADVLVGPLRIVHIEIGGDDWKEYRGASIKWTAEVRKAVKS